MNRIYLDYAATTPVDPEVVAAMLPFFTESYGNPSSVHSIGQEAKEAVEAAREEVASLLSAHPEEIVFTSGGTEADNFALKGVAYANRGKGNHIITTAIEHHAVFETCHFLEQQGFEVTFLPVDSYGLVDPDNVRKALTPKTILISVMHANNEIGTIEPLAEIGVVAKEAGVYFHTDAVQTVGHIPIDVNQLNIDLLSTSAHKLYGPKGVGAIYIRKGTDLTTFMHGGEQEQGRRAGTHNVPGIVGFGKAVELAKREMESEAVRLTRLRDRLISGLIGKLDDIRLNGHPRKRLPNNVNLAIDFVEGEASLMALDLEGICVSTGSACSSESQEASHVLLAIGLPPECARSALRFSLGKWTSEEEIARVLEVVPRVIGRLRAMSPLYKKS
ncbi:MAG: cysteine desulfurase NifS [Chloroflexota bacterium]